MRLSALVFVDIHDIHADRQTVLENKRHRTMAMKVAIFRVSIKSCCLRTLPIVLFSLDTFNTVVTSGLVCSKHIKPEINAVGNVSFSLCLCQGSVYAHALYFTKVLSATQVLNAKIAKHGLFVKRCLSVLNVDTKFRYKMNFKIWKIYLFVLFSICLSLSAVAEAIQAPSIEWARSCGGSGFDRVWSIQQTAVILLREIPAQTTGMCQKITAKMIFGS